MTLEELLHALFDQSGCDCDSSIDWRGGWSAPNHASDCPVYERWSPKEDEAFAEYIGRIGGVQ